MAEHRSTAAFSAHSPLPSCRVEGYVLSACQDEELRAGVSVLVLAWPLNLGNGTVMFKECALRSTWTRRMFDPFCAALGWEDTWAETIPEMGPELSILYPT